MGDRTKVEFADATWNPLRGCSDLSRGCRNCFAKLIAARMGAPGKPFEGYAFMQDGKPFWTGKVKIVERVLMEPLTWRQERAVYVGSMSDLFHPELAQDERDAIHGTMALCGQHTFQILTKRPEAMCAYYGDPEVWARIEKWARAIYRMHHGREYPSQGHLRGPMPNIWAGTSIEDQRTANRRLPWLLKTVACRRFVAYEPAIAPVDATLYLNAWKSEPEIPKIDWLVCGGESGPYARPLHPYAASWIRDQCLAAGTSFFFKQWGEWSPVLRRGAPFEQWGYYDQDEKFHPRRRIFLQSETARQHPVKMWRIGKEAAGRELDGRVWDEMPEPILHLKPTGGPVHLENHP
jgi:protein gp37